MEELDGINQWQTCPYIGLIEVLFFVLGEGLPKFFIERITDGIGNLVGWNQVKTIFHQWQIVLYKVLAGCNIDGYEVFQVVLLHLFYKSTYLVRFLLGIKGCVLFSGNSLMIEKQLLRIGDSDELQVDISTLEDIGTCLEDLFYKGTSYGATSKDRQIDALGDFEYFPMNHIDRLGKVFLMHYHTDVTPSSGVID